ncbi:hypothetical protein NYA22BAC_03484 (plasmid) [Parasphingorhabdus sp. NYA22]
MISKMLRLKWWGYSVGKENCDALSAIVTQTRVNKTIALQQLLFFSKCLRDWISSNIRVEQMLITRIAEVYKISIDGSYKLADF